MKNILITITFICIFQFSYSQLPMKKDSLIGTKQMKKLMTDNGFTYYKVIEYPKDKKLNKSIAIFYKEEVRLSIRYNDFNNIENIAIYTGNANAVEQIKKVVEYKKWEFSHTEKDFLGTKEIYKVYNYSAQFVFKPEYIDDVSGKHSVYQFLIYN